MVKTRQLTFAANHYTSITATINENQYSHKSVWFDGTYYYVCEVDVSGNQINKVNRYNSDWTNKTTLSSQADTLGGLRYTAIKKVGDDILAVFPTDQNTFWTAHYTNIDTTWTWAEIAIPDSGTFNGVDIWYSDSLGTWLVVGHDIVNNVIRFYSHDTGLFKSSTSSTATALSGYALDTEYYYIYYDNPTYYYEKFDAFADSITQISTPTLSGGSAFLFYAGELMRFSATAILLITPTKLWGFNGTTWYEQTQAIAEYYTPLYDTIDAYYNATASYFVGDTQLFSLVNNRVVLQMHRATLTNLQTANIKMGWGTHLFLPFDDGLDPIENYTWKRYTVDLATSDFFIDYVPADIVESESNAEIKTIYPLYENEYIALYNDSSVFLHGGEAKNINTKDGIITGQIRSLLYIDLEQPITYTSSSNETIATLFTNIILTYFKYGTAGTLTSSATTYPWNFQNRKIRDIFTVAAHVEGRTWYHTPTLAIQLNLGTIDSTKTHKSSDGVYPGSISQIDNTQKIGTVVGTGAAGITYTYTKDLSNGTFYIYDQSLAQAELQAWVIQYATLENQTQHQYTLNYVFGLLPLQVGTQLTFEYVLGDYNVTSALMYIKEIQYNALDNYIIRLVLHDVMFFKKEGISNQQNYAYTRQIQTDLQDQIDTITSVSGLIQDDAYDASWNGDTTIGASRNALYDKIETLALKAITLTGAGAIAIDTDQAAHDLSTNRTISLENDAGNNITHIETTALTDSLVKIPASGLVLNSFQAQMNPTGLETLPTLSMVSTHIFTITGDHRAWYHGLLYTKTTATLDMTAFLNGIWFIYYDASGVLSSSQTAWDILTTIQIAIVYKNGTSYTIFDERHGCSMSPATHLYLHDTRKTAYEEGLTAAPTDSNLSLSNGEFHDEDLEFTITGADPYQVVVMYRDTTPLWNFTALQDSWWVAGVGGRPYWDNAGTLTELDNQKYGVYYLIATNGYSFKIASIMGQASYNTLALARSANYTDLNFLTFATAEVKALYKIIIQASASAGTYIEMQDLRTNPQLAGVTPVSTDHGSLAGLTDLDHPATAIINTPAGNIAATTVQAAINELDSEKAALAGATFTGALAQTTGQAITDNAIITADAADIADNDYAKFTANGLEGRSYSEVKSDLSLSGIIEVYASMSQAAIQTILDSGGYIHFNAGTYTLTTTFDIDQNKSICIYGDGDGTYLYLDADGISIFNITSTPSCIIRDMKLHRLSSAASASENGVIFINEASDAKVICRNLTLYAEDDTTNATLSGIIRIKSNNCEILHCNLTGYTKTLYGIVIEGGTNTLLLENTISTLVAGDAIVFSLGASNKAIRNIISGVVNGIIVATSTNTILHNYITSATSGIYVFASLTSGNIIYNNIIHAVTNGVVSDTTFTGEYVGYNSIEGVLTSNIATGTAPLTIASTTKVSNLNVDQLDGADLETASISNDNIHIPASALVYAVKTTADAALPTTGGTSKYLKALDSQNYKGWQCLAWGAGSTGLTNTYNSLTNQTVDGHLTAITLAPSAADQLCRNTDALGLTAGCISLWLRPNQTNKDIYIMLTPYATGGGYETVLRLKTDGKFWVCKPDLDDLYEIGTYTANTWFHLVVKWVKNTYAEYYLNGVLVYTNTTTLGNYDVNYLIIYANTTTGTIDTDAWYLGTDKTAAFLSLTDSQVYNKYDTEQDERIEDVKTTADNSVQKSGANTVTDTFGLTPTTTNTNSVGSATKALAAIYSRIVQSDDSINIVAATGKSFVLKSGSTSVLYSNTNVSLVSAVLHYFNDHLYMNVNNRNLYFKDSAGNYTSYLNLGSDDTFNIVNSKASEVIVLKTGATPLPVLQINTSVASADSYVQITNGKAGTSDTIIESAGTANNLRLQAGAAKTLNFYIGTALQAIWQAGIQNFYDTYMVLRKTDAATSPTLDFQRRIPTTDNVVDTTILADIKFSGYHTDGYDQGASIRAVVTGTPGNGDMPTSLRFLTSPDGSATPLEVLRLNTSVTSAVNYLAVTNSATGNPPTIAATGTDTDINLLLQTKGAGHVYVKDEAGNWESIEADDFVNNSPKVYEAGLADLIAMSDVNDHKQLPSEVKRIYQDPIMRTEIQSKMIMDEETKEESVRDVEVQVIDHYEERVAESLGSAVQWLKRSLQQEHQEKIELEQRVQTLEQQLQEIKEAIQDAQKT